MMLLRRFKNGEGKLDATEGLLYTGYCTNLFNYYGMGNVIVSVFNTK